MRALYLMFGGDKFKSIISDWFRIVHMSEMKFSRAIANVNVSQLESYRNAMEIKQSNPSILTILEQYVIQYNIVPLENVSIRNVLRSWIVAKNDIIVSIDRDYNNREARLSIESVEGQNVTRLMYAFSIYL